MITSEPATAPASSQQPSPLATGHQYEIGRHGARAVVTEVGATLRAFEVDGQPFLDALGADDIPDAGHGQLLVPFPNRVADGRYRWDGREHQLPINEVACDNAIHGLARWTNWQVRERADHRITLGLVLHPQEGYPFVLDLAVSYTVAERSLHVQQTARNLGRTAAPFGVGFHPYLTVGTPTIDCNVLRLPATSYFLTDDRLIPTGTATVADTPYDFRTPRPVGSVDMDTGFTNVLRDPDGWARATLAAPDGPTLELLMGAGYDYFQVFTGDPLPEPRRRTGIAIEPYTCAPNAFNNGLGLVRLAPGQETTSTWAVQIS
jgi:aldose 1-epimerase